MAILRTIARHGMTKGAAFFYAVAVGAAANFVLDYVHRHDAAIPVVAHETVPTIPERDRAVAPVARPEPRPSKSHIGEPRVIEPHEPARPTTASLPPVREVKPLPEPTPAALPKVPTLPLPSASTAALPSQSDLPIQPLKPVAVPNLSAAPAAPSEDRPIFSVPPSAPAAAAAVPPVDKPADKPVEAMTTPTPTPSVGNPISLLPPPPAPPAPAAPKPASGTGGLY